MKHDKIYILSEARIESVSQFELRDEFEKLKATRPEWSKKSFTKFLAKKKDMHESKYVVHTHDMAYFRNQEEGEYYALANMEAYYVNGCPPYLVLYTRPMDVMCADMVHSDIRLFRYHKDYNIYSEVTSQISKNPEYLYIAAKYDINILLPPE